jgi:hypothetical protein
VHFVAIEKKLSNLVGVAGGFVETVAIHCMYVAQTYFLRLIAL